MVHQKRYYEAKAEVFKAIKNSDRTRTDLLKIVKDNDTLKPILRELIDQGLIKRCQVKRSRGRPPHSKPKTEMAGVRVKYTYNKTIMPQVNEYLMLEESAWKPATVAWEAYNKRHQEAPLESPLLTREEREKMLLFPSYGRAVTEFDFKIKSLLVRDRRYILPEKRADFLNTIYNTWDLSEVPLRPVMTEDTPNYVLWDWLTLMRTKKSQVPNIQY